MEEEVVYVEVGEDIFEEHVSAKHEYGVYCYFEYHKENTEWVEALGCATWECSNFDVANINHLEILTLLIILLVGLYVGTSVVWLFISL